MPWTIGHQAEADVILLTAEGRQLRDDAIEQTRQATSLGNQLGLHRYLSDCSLAEYDLEFLDVFMLPQIFRLLGLPTHCRMAVIPPVSRYRLALFKYFEQVCADHHYAARLFDDRAAALGWLKG